MFVSVLSPVCCVCLCLTFYGNLKVLSPLPGEGGGSSFSLSPFFEGVFLSIIRTITIKVGFFDILFNTLPAFHACISLGGKF